MSVLYKSQNSDHVRCGGDAPYDPAGTCLFCVEIVEDFLDAVWPCKWVREHRPACSGWTNPKNVSEDEQLEWISGNQKFPDSYDPLVARCLHCNSEPFLIGNEPDPCLGVLPGVDLACCGHGGEGAIHFTNGTRVRFKEILP